MKISRRALALLLALAAASALAACGSDEQDSSGKDAGGLDAAFLKSMIPHHESAVEMAKMARDRAQHREIKELAAAIIDAQQSEIAQMEDIYKRLYGEEILPDPNAGEELGLSMDESGMHDGAMGELESATRDFDKVFIDQMIPHHQGAIRQARALLADESADAEVGALAESIIEAQSREIEQMNDWRKRWYGAKSPAGGVPSRDELAPASDEHSSGHSG